MTTTAAELQLETEQALLRAVDLKLIGLAEVRAAATLAAHVRHGRGLTSDQARQAWRILHRHQAKLSARGIDLPGVTPPAPPKPVVITPRAVRQVQVAMRPDGQIGVTDAPMELNDVFRNALHSRWDKQQRQWPFAATPAYAHALLTALEGYDHAVSPRVQALAEEFRARERARRVLDPNAPVPEYDYSKLIVPGASVWEHQARGIEFAAASSSVLWAIPMGGGKTATAVWTVNRLRLPRVIIVCPNKVRGVWPREITKWSNIGWHVVDGRRPGKRKGSRAQDLKVAERLHQAEQCLYDCACDAAVHAAVMNYEMLVHSPVDTWVPQGRISGLIYDEAHRLKSPTGKMSKVAAEWVDFTDRRMGLTGTPMPQYPWDIFGVYRALDPGIFGPIWTSFKNEYVEQRVRKEDGKEFPVAIKKDVREKFTAKVHSIMYRPEVDLKLPGAKHVMRAVELETTARREYERLDEHQWADLAEFVAADPDEESGDEKTLTPKNVLSRMLRQMQFTGGVVPDDEGVKTTVSTAKAEHLEEVLDEIGCIGERKPEDREPVVVYCQFRDDLDVVRGLAEKLKLRYAEISGRKSDGLTPLSEMNPNCDVLGVQIQSGGTGVDLTRSCYGVWYSVGHSLGDYDQALKRQDRPGQKRPVTFIHLVASMTVDEDVYAGLASRRSVVGSFLKARGVDLGKAGLESDDGAVMTLDEMEAAFNAQRAAEQKGDRQASAVALPTDDFGKDVLVDPRAPGRRRSDAGVEVPDEETMKAFDLDGFFD